jgi:hypothetical protein
MARRCSNKHTRYVNTNSRYGEAPAAAASWRAHDGSLQRGVEMATLGS